MKKYIVGVDTGGTFTDATVLREDGEIFIDKSSTTPHDFSIGVLNALTEVSKHVGIPREELLKNANMVKHGCTVATNALITGTGSKVGLITTRGFEDTTLIMRAFGRVAGMGEEEIKHQSTAVKPKPVVPKSRIRGVSERIDLKGNVTIPLNEEEVREALKSLIEDEQVDAIAINLLFSFMNSVHEEKIMEIFQEMYGDRDIFVSVSHKLVPVMREYARSNTTILNSFLGKTVDTYLGDLSEKLDGAGYEKPLLIMQSNGGIGYKEEIEAIGNLGSGPCGGMIGSKYMADYLGHENVITCDMGGTSFDVGLLINGFWAYSYQPVVERLHITWPMIDIESIGAGGGTIAWIHPDTNRLMLGPNSAGASPGPICYERGGEEVTVTDANLMLGYLDPNYFLGGRMTLNKAKTEKILKEKIAGPLGMDPMEAAGGVYDIINAKMTDLMRKKIVSTGHVPEEFSVYAFGGAGSIHANAYASDLGLKSVHVFPTAAVFSAFGISVADIIRTYTVSYRYLMPVEPDVMNKKLEEIEEEHATILSRQGFNRDEIEFRRSFEMRYRRQLNELTVQVPSKKYDEADMKAIADTFERRYEEVYGEGSAYSEAGIEIMAIRVDAIVPMMKPQIKTFPLASELPSKDALKGKREVYFTEEKKFINTNIYNYDRLNPGNIVDGPAVLETPITTVVVLPSSVAKIDECKNIEITLNKG